MKRLVTILSLLVVILGVAVGGIFYIKVTTERFSAELDQISGQILLVGDEISSATLTKEVDSLCKEWEKTEKLLGMYLKHEDMGEISKNLQKLRGYCQVAYLKEAVPLVVELQFSLHHLYEEELPTLKNIL